jgi:hypothetical protein
MIEYPKAVYQGENQSSYIAKIVNDSDEELLAQAEGFVDYYDLGKANKKSKKSNTVEAVDNGNNELLDTSIGDSELAAPQ